MTLRQAAEAALDHVTELRDAWMRGCLNESDGKGGTRSNRNVAVENALRAALDAPDQPEPETIDAALDRIAPTAAGRDYIRLLHLADELATALRITLSRIESDIESDTFKCHEGDAARSVLRRYDSR